MSIVDKIAEVLLAIEAREVNIELIRQLSEE